MMEKVSRLKRNAHDAENPKPAKFRKHIPQDAGHTRSIGLITFEPHDPKGFKALFHQSMFRLPWPYAKLKNAYIRRNCFKYTIKPLVGDPRTHIEEFTVDKEIAVSQSPWIKAECPGGNELGELKVPGENSETFRCCLQWMY
jgi:hypothetical protein